MESTGIEFSLAVMAPTRAPVEAASYDVNVAILALLRWRHQFRIAVFADSSSSPAEEGSGKISELCSYITH